MAREVIQRYTDYNVLAVAPKYHNWTTDVDVVINDAGGGSASFKVYDPSKDELISADEAIGQTELSVSDVGVFDVGDSVEVTQNNGVILSSTVSAVDSTAGTITIADSLAVAADLGSRVRVIFGASVSMTEYGTANLNTRDWGYRGLFALSNPAHSDTRAKDGLEINIEISVDGGSNRDSLDVICALIRENDCE